MAINDKSPSRMSNKSQENKSPAKTGGKGVTCNINLLDGETLPVSLDKNDTGRVLFDKVCTHLDLIERDYFGFTYTDERGPSHLKYWLNLDKKITKQKKPGGAWVFDFALKFYPPDPAALRESLTRWLVVLQIRRDLLSGRLPCTFTTYALLGSYNVQADVGEYDPSDHGNSHDYIRNMSFAPNQTPELLEKIAELHKQHKGQTPDEAEKCFLDNAKKLSMYGVDLHKAKDADNNAVMLGVCCSGVLIYRDKLRINRFVWPKILKLSYKRNSFFVKIRPGELERGEATIMFKLDNHRLAKRLWKTCVEHHSFFRLREAEKPANNVSFPRFGSKFRYSGRTLYQTRQQTALLDRPQPFFERSQPNRYSMGPDAANRSRSMDELGQRKGRENDYGTYPRNHSTSYDYDPTKYDERDKRDYIDDPKAFEQLNHSKDSRGDDEGSTLNRRPYDTDTADRRDRLHGPDDATLEREKPRGDANDSMGVIAGNIDAVGSEKQETDKERRKREKEEDKRRKKEAEEKKKKEDEERKRLEREKKKKGKGDLDTSEDRSDRKGPNDATETAFGVGPGSVGVDGDKILLRGPQPGDESTDDKDKKDKDGSEDDGEYYPKENDGKGVFYDKDGNEIPYDKDGKIGKGYPYGADRIEDMIPSEIQYDQNGEVIPLSKERAAFGSENINGEKYPNGEGGKAANTGDDDGEDDDEGGKKDKDGKQSSSWFGWLKGKVAGDGSDDPNDSQAGGEDKAGIVGTTPGGAYPYGVGFGVGKGDMTGVVGDESEVDNKQYFEPVPKPIKETKESLKSGDGLMPFFHPAATSTVGRNKVPPPVAPKNKGNYSNEDSFNYKTEKDGVEQTRVEQKVVITGDGDEDDYDFDAALAEAIRSVTEFNPDMSVERIECVQQIEDVKDGK